MGVTAMVGLVQLMRVFKVYPPGEAVRQETKVDEGNANLEAGTHTLYTEYTVLGGFGQ